MSESNAISSWIQGNRQRIQTNNARIAREPPLPPHHGHSRHPRLELKGDNPEQYVIPTVWVDPGAFAHDRRDGIITDNIVVDSSAINSSLPGTYKVFYTITNSRMKSTTKTREVIYTAAVQVQVQQPPLAGGMLEPPKAEVQQPPLAPPKAEITPPLNPIPT